MKKRIIKAGSIAFGITTLMGIINYILGTMFETIIGITFWGGETSSTYGFGIELLKSYPLCSSDNPIEYNDIIYIAPVNYVLTIVMLTIVIYLILFIVNKCKNRKKKGI